MNDYFYLDVSLKIESGKELIIDEYKLRSLIFEGLRTLFGECGSSTEVDILKFSIKDKRAILRCLSDTYVKVRASLSFVSECDGSFLSFHVNKASSSLPCLQSNSRTYNFI